MSAIALPDAGIVPLELRQRPQWVAWVYKGDGGKLPINPRTGKAASASDPTTWSTFETAYRYAERRGVGVGYVFAADDPYTGIDFDDCRSKDTGAIKAATWQQIEALSSYAEVSPSGCGVKAIVKAKLGKAHKNQHIELYDRGRFFTITGQVVQGLPLTVEERQAEVDSLIREHFPSNGHSAEPISETIPYGTQHNTLVSLAGTMRKRGMGVDEIEAALQIVNAQRCERPGPPENIRQIAESVCTLYPAGEAPTARANGKPEIRLDQAPSLLCMADVQPQPVRWLWPGRIPLGKLTIVDGDPGLGKSLITLDLAARVSCGGAMPDGAACDLDGPAGVVLLTAEDDPADTIRPRLDAAGADCSRIVMLQGIRETTTLPDGTEKTTTRLPTLGDIVALERAVQEVGAKLVIVDPVMAYTGKADSHVDSEVRAVLARLAEMAQRLGVAVVVVRHLNKTGGGNPLYRGGGSIGFIASARSGLLVAPDPDDPNGRRRILASTKSNLAELASSLAYAIEAPYGVAQIHWLGSSDHSAKTLLAAQNDGEEKTAVDEAKDFLTDLLSDGPVEAKVAKAEAKDAGISERTLARAKTLLGVRAVKLGFGDSGRWMWDLPANKQTDNQPKDAKDPLRMPRNTNIGNLASLGNLGTLRLLGRSLNDEIDLAPLRGEVIAAAENRGWPQVRLRDGTLGPGEDAWQKFVEWANEQQLRDALTALKGGAP